MPRVYAMKRCCSCKAPWPLSKFSKDASSSDGYNSRCVMCESEQKAIVRARELDKKEPIVSDPTWRGDLTGGKIGRLTVKCRAYSYGHEVHWVCICECGNRRDVSGKTLRRALGADMKREPVRPISCLMCGKRGALRDQVG
jgi:hypothetical protein